jgi:ribokinase
MNDTIAVLGSINYDIVTSAERLPRKGETVRGYGFEVFTGGKGGNQAVQIALLGLKSVFIGQVGSDEQGKTVLAGLAEKGVDYSGAGVQQGGKTGCCLITVAPDGSNTLIHTPGANHAITTAMIDKAAGRIRSAGMLIMQNEINMDAILYGLRIAADAGVPCLLNPAPAIPLPGEVWPMLDCVTPNETEAAYYTGINQEGVSMEAWRRDNARWFLERGVKQVVITLGPQGAYWTDGKDEVYKATFPIKPVDTTAAGDSFIGGFACGIVRGLGVEQCLDLGNACGSVSVATKGAQNSIQGRDRILGFLREQGITLTL